MTPSNAPAFFLLKRRLPVSESSNLLGRVVRLYEDPTYNYAPESPSSSLTDRVFSRFLLNAQYDTDAVFNAQVSKDNSLGGKLSGLLSVSTETIQNSSTTIESPQIITQQLKLTAEYFETLKGDPNIRRKILEMCPVGGKAFLIVGIMGAETAKYKYNSHNTTSIDASAVLSVGALASLTASLPLEAIPSPEASVKRSASSGQTMVFDSIPKREDVRRVDVGEVFAIAYKEISRSWRGLGKDIIVRERPLEYRGGQHFGKEDDSSDSEEDEDFNEAAEALAADGLSLVDGEESQSGEGFFVYL